jgi:hypothetical protein
VKSHLIKRIAGLLVAVGILVGMTLVAPVAAQAAPCNTAAHVYVFGTNFKWEWDPIDGPVNTVTIFEGQSIRLGGNGMRADEDPFWVLYRESNGTPASTFIGSRAGDNCVSNEKNFPVFGKGSYIVRASYYPGNSGGVITNQAHFRLVVQ